MNRNKHMLIGALAALGVYVGYKCVKGEKLTLKGIVVAPLLGIFGGYIPDLLEPAMNPNHRGSFHSVTLLAILVYVEYKITTTDKLTTEQKSLLLSLITAYQSHLLADSTTKKGLPIIK